MFCFEMIFFLYLKHCITLKAVSQMFFSALLSSNYLKKNTQQHIFFLRRSYCFIQHLSTKLDQCGDTCCQVVVALFFAVLLGFCDVDYLG